MMILGVPLPPSCGDCSLRILCPRRHPSDDDSRYVPIAIPAMMILGVSLPPSQRRCSRCASVTPLWRGPHPVPAAASPRCCLLPAAPGLLCVLGARRPLFAASSSPLYLELPPPLLVRLGACFPSIVPPSLDCSPSPLSCRRWRFSVRPSIRAAVSVPRLFSDCLASTSRPRGCLPHSLIALLPCQPTSGYALRSFAVCLAALLLAVGTSSTASLVRC